MFDRPRLRVLSIAHTAVSRDAGRRRYHPLADDPTLDVHLVVPASFTQFGRVLQADPADDPGIEVHILPIRWPSAGPAKWYMHTYRGLGALVQRLQPDVIHLWEEPWSMVALQAAWLQRRVPQAALVLEVDQNILKRLPAPFELTRRTVLGRTDLVLSRGADATAVVRARGYEGPALQVGYGVDLDLFYPGRDTVAQGALRLGYVGRIVPEKGLDDALVALAGLDGAELAIMGEGPHEAALRQHAAALGIADRLSFRGWGAPAEVAAFLRKLDITLLLTRTDGAVREQFGRVILESQACGVPVIGSTSGAIPDVVGPGGWIVPERNPAALASLLAQLDTDRGAIRACGLQGIVNVESRFTYAAVARTLASAWRQSVQEHARRARDRVAPVTAGLPSSNRH